jgi:hypothetical protein
MLDALGDKAIHHANKPYMDRQLDLCEAWLKTMRAIVGQFAHEGAEKDTDVIEPPSVAQNAGVMFVGQDSPYERGGK